LSLTKKEMAEKWGLPPKDPAVKPGKPQKKTVKTGLDKVKAKIDAEKKDDSLDDFAELISKSRKAELEQEISKAETMKYKAEQERLKLKRAAGEVMEFNKGEILFFGFIDKASFEMLRLMDKFEPVIKNLTAENDYKSIILTVNRELENILQNIQEEQATAVDDWQKSLK